MTTTNARHQIPQLPAWNTPKTAPRDQIIIADFGYPWAVAAIWNPSMGQWAITELEWNMFDGAGDPGFITELQPETELRGWKPMPAVPVRCDTNANTLAQSGG